jgi:hypothetical protein
MGGNYVCPRAVSEHHIRWSVLAAVMIRRAEYGLNETAQRAEIVGSNGPHLMAELGVKHQ